MNDYEDIINLPHHVSRNHPRMTMYQRAAQFAPFAALSGHNEAMAQTERENISSYEKDSLPQDDVF